MSERDKVPASYEDWGRENWPNDWLRDKVMAIARSMLKAKDGLLVDALSKATGCHVSMDDAQKMYRDGRVKREQHAGKDVYLLDGKPLIELYPVELQNSDKDYSFTVTAKQSYRVFRTGE